MVSRAPKQSVLVATRRTTVSILSSLTVTALTPKPMARHVTDANEGTLIGF